MLGDEMDRNEDHLDKLRSTTNKPGTSNKYAALPALSIPPAHGLCISAGMIPR